MKPPKLLASLCLLSLSPPLEATWSVVLVDVRTKEVAIGSVTCLTNFDLRAFTPVLRVGLGGATSQSLVDSEGTRRRAIHDGLSAGLPPQRILLDLAAISGHEDRQYGIVDTFGRSVTFSGISNGGYAGGVVGSVGDIHYAIQGNVITGACVVEAAEQAVRDTQGDIPARLLAAMEAARLAGGDGRCSCSENTPTTCGCQLVLGRKSGHIGYLLDARAGDQDDPTCNSNGCADGQYFLNLNAAFKTGADPDPVVSLRQGFAAWRESLTGRTDAVATSAEIVPVGEGYELRIELKDWQGTAVTAQDLDVVATREENSTGDSQIGDFVSLGEGRYTAAITVGLKPGLDRFRVAVTDAQGTVVLMPSPHLCLVPPGEGSTDCNSNAIPDECEALSGSIPDVNQNGLLDVCEPDCDQDQLPDEWAISSGTAKDCNRNGTPDSCDLAAFTSADCNRNAIPDECDLAAGIARDCNLNTVPDTCDIASGLEQDCNRNRRPDACEIAAGTVEDCNQNSVPDRCDISGGTSLDQDKNSIPDECEGGLQRPGDLNQDAVLDLSDAIWLLGHLFLGTQGGLPCQGSTASQPSSSDLALADLTGDGAIDLSDAVRVLVFLFQGEAPPALGTECVRLLSCPERCLR